MEFWTHLDIEVALLQETLRKLKIPYCYSCLWQIILAALPCVNMYCMQRKERTWMETSSEKSWIIEVFADFSTLVVKLLISTGAWSSTNLYHGMVTKDFFQKLPLILIQLNQANKSRLKWEEKALLIEPYFCVLRMICWVLCDLGSLFEHC